MIEGGSSLGFPLKATAALLVLNEMWGEKLQGNETLELEIFGLVDHAHPALAELFDDFVMRDGRTEHG